MSKKRYPPRTPRTAHGFRAQELRSVPRGAWWVRQWLNAIDAMRLGARAGRGRVYAERGQVTGLSISGSHVDAVVAGGRSDPYSVKIDFATFPPDGGGLTARLGMMSVARILAGEMPTTVDEQFSIAGISPYPTLGVDRFWCSCPDWSKPCKHIAAVLYLLGDALTRDPSLLLRLRGVDLAQGRETAVPLWKGCIRLSDALDGIYRRTGIR